MGWQNSAAWLSDGGGWYKNVASGSEPLSITYESVQSTTTFSSNLATFTSVAVGTTDATSIVAVCIPYKYGAGTPLVTAVTVGGVSASQATGAAQTDATNLIGTGIWYAPYNGAANPTVTVQFGAAISRATIYVYNVSGTGAAFSSGGGGASHSATKSQSGTVTVPAGGGTIAVAMMISTAAPTGASLSGTSISDRFSITDGGTHGYFVGHDVADTGSQTFTVTFTAGTAQGCNLSLATFSP